MKIFGLFIGDFGNENVDRVKSVSKLEFQTQLFWETMMCGILISSLQDEFK